jgi:hypothetical protein
MCLPNTKQRQPTNCDGLVEEIAVKSKKEKGKHFLVLN